MFLKNKKLAAIVDFGLGNLFNMERALTYIGAQTEISDRSEKILSAERLIIPGVGAFGDAGRLNS